MQFEIDCMHTEMSLHTWPVYSEIENIKGWE